QLIGDYSKTHLFDAFTSKESDTVDAGADIGIVDFDFGKAGIAICYELRFPDYLRTLALKGIEVLFVPSAFYTPRHDQWDVLVQSAALDNLLYVVALNQYNEHFFGRSCIADPCGLIVSKVSDQEGIMYGILDMNYQQTVRSQVPTYQNRRPELYEVK
ncbi:MAG: carbon-nitrogen hydrolase family protein, partial [Emergencia timonensis]